MCGFSFWMHLVFLLPPPPPALSSHLVSSHLITSHLIYRPHPLPWHIDLHNTSIYMTHPSFPFGIPGIWLSILRLTLSVLLRVLQKKRAAPTRLKSSVFLRSSLATPLAHLSHSLTTPLPIPYHSLTTPLLLHYHSLTIPLPHPYRSRTTPLPLLNHSLNIV